MCVCVSFFRDTYGLHLFISAGPLRCEPTLRLSPLSSLFLSPPHNSYKVRLFLNVPDDDNAAVEMMYIQATHDVVDARYPCSEQDSITLAALQVGPDSYDVQ